MSIVESQVRAARRRLNVNVLAEAAVRGLLLAAALVGLVLVLDRVLGTDLPPASLAGVGLAVFVGVAGWHGWRGAVGRLRAAVAIDKAAGLKERVSTALVVAHSSDPFAVATVRDAQVVCARIHLPTHIPYRMPPQWPASFASVAVAALLYGLMPQLDLLKRHRPKTPAEDAAQAQVELANTKQALAEHKQATLKRLEDKPQLRDIADDLKNLDQIPDKPSAPEDVRREVAKRIEKVEDKLRQRLESSQLQGLENLKKQLASLEMEDPKNPAAELTKTLAAGDVAGARKQLDALKDQLKEASDKSAPAARQQLAEMQKGLEELARKLDPLANTEKLQKELENKAGLSPEEAKKLAEQLARMDPSKLEQALKDALSKSGLTPEQFQELAKKFAENREMLRQCQQLSQCMQAVAQACRNASDGDGPSQAMQAEMSAASDMLSELELAEQMMSELQAQLSDLQSLKESSSKGGFCQGSGNRASDRTGPQGPSYGRGRGERIGKESVAHQYDRQKAATKSPNGQIIGQMLFDGPQLKGEAYAEAQSAVAAALRDATDAIEREEIPRRYQSVARKYFESLAGLLAERTGQPVSETPGKADTPADAGEAKAPDAGARQSP